MIDKNIISPNQKADYAILGEAVRDARNIEAETFEEKLERLKMIKDLIGGRLQVHANERKNNAEDRANDLHNRQFGTNFKRREVESKGFDDTTHIKENFDL